MRRQSSLSAVQAAGLSIAPLVSFFGGCPPLLAGVDLNSMSVLWEQRFGGFSAIPSSFIWGPMPPRMLFEGLIQLHMMITGSFRAMLGCS